MLKSYRSRLISLSLLLVLFYLVRSNAGTIDSHSTGIWNHYFVYPISYMIQFVAHHIPELASIAIIVITLVVRSAMIPLAVSQYRSQMKMKKCNLNCRS